MQHSFTLEYWEDDKWYVGRLKEVPGVFSQGETIEELEDNILDAYILMTTDDEDNSRRPDQEIIASFLILWHFHLEENQIL